MVEILPKGNVEGTGIMQVAASATGGIVGAVAEKQIVVPFSSGQPVVDSAIDLGVGVLIAVLAKETMGNHAYLGPAAVGFGFGWSAGAIGHALNIW